MATEQRNGRMALEHLCIDVASSAVIKSEAEIERRLRGLRDPASGEPLRVTKFRVDGGACFDVQGSAAAIEIAKRMVMG